METIIQKLDRDASSVRVMDVRDQRILVERRYDSFPLSTTTLDLHDLSGATTRLASDYQHSLWSSLVQPPRIFGPYILWVDPYNADLVIYNIDSETTRRIDPRALLENPQADQPPAPQPPS